VAQYAVSVEVTLAEPVVETRRLVELAETVLAGEAVDEGTGLAILITDDEEMRSMNREFLGIDEPTDVLSFPDEAGTFVRGMADQPFLGDIAIGLSVAQRQAAELGHGLEQELGHLLVHGILHLCGYDHVEGGEEEMRMRAREEHYLGDLGAAHRHAS
jgi:probable rRNA maturation factor